MSVQETVKVIEWNKRIMRKIDRIYADFKGVMMDPDIMEVTNELDKDIETDLHMALIILENWSKLFDGRIKKLDSLV